MQVKPKRSLQPIPILPCLPPLPLAFITDTLPPKRSTLKQTKTLGRADWQLQKDTDSLVDLNHFISKCFALTGAEPSLPRLSVLPGIYLLSLKPLVTRPRFSTLNLAKRLCSYQETLSQANHDTRPPFHGLHLQFQTKPNVFYWCSNVKRRKTRETTKPALTPCCKIWRIYLHQVQRVKVTPKKQKVKTKQPPLSPPENAPFATKLTGKGWKTEAIHICNGSDEYN